MNHNETQSSSGAISENVSGVENPGAFSGKPSAALPESAISAENNGSSGFEYKTLFAEQTHTYIREY